MHRERWFICLITFPAYTHFKERTTERLQKKRKGKWKWMELKKGNFFVYFKFVYLRRIAWCPESLLPFDSYTNLLFICLLFFNINKNPTQVSSKTHRSHLKHTHTYWKWHTQLHTHTGQVEGVANWNNEMAHGKYLGNGGENAYNRNSNNNNNNRLVCDYNEIIGWYRYGKMEQMRDFCNKFSE